jgi:predicted Rossmann fold nucleotide-binding protein DprA/Smf involved in DNA uptake
MPVYALPGPVSSPLSSGTNAMIARGFAHMIEGAEALVALLCAELGASAPPAASSVGSDPLRQLFSSSSPLDLAELLEAGRTRGLGELQILEGVERLLESGELVKSGFYLEWRGAL